MCLISTSFYKLVYSGHAWNHLFDDDRVWNIKKIRPELFRKFKHFRGLKSLRIFRGSYDL